MIEKLIEHLSALDDPRCAGKVEHRLIDILVIAVCAVIACAESWEDIALYGRSKQAWLRRFLAHGIPSHDTLSDVMGRLKPGAFAELMLRWVRAALPRQAGEQVCVDGKRLRGSGEGEAAVHVVSAYAARARRVLTQRAVADKANEIVAIPDLLSMLELAGAVVTMDAMGCQKAIARQIVEAGADYVLALKDNHPTLSGDVRLWLDTQAVRGALPVRETVEKDHGRIEIRRYHLSSDLDWLESKADWTGLFAVGRVESIRTIDGKTRPNAVTICARSPPSNASPRRRGATGPLKTANIGCWMCSSARTPTGPGKIILRRIWAWLGGCRSTSSATTTPSSKVSLRRRKRLASLNDDYRSRLIFGEAGT